MPSNEKQKAGLSNEYVYDSTDEEADKPTELNLTKKTGIATSSGVKRNNDTKTTKASSRPQAKENNEKRTPSTAEHSNDFDLSSTESASEQSSSSDSDSDKKRKAETSQRISNSQKKSKTIPANSTVVNAKPFNVPTGYEALTLGASDYATETADMFTNISNKQIWHISAPEDMPIQSIASINLQEALQGKPILRRGHSNYVLHPSSNTNRRLLINKRNDTGYEAAPTQISQSYEIRESNDFENPTPQAGSAVRRDNNQDGVLRFTAEVPGKKKIPRVQPKGLKMRYVPYGSFDGSVDFTKPKTSETFQVPDNVVDSEEVGVSKNKKSKGQTKEPAGSQIEKLKEKETPAPLATRDEEEQHSQSGPGEVSPVERKKKKKKAKLVDIDNS